MNISMNKTVSIFLLSIASLSSLQLKASWCCWRSNVAINPEATLIKKKPLTQQEISINALNAMASLDQATRRANQLVLDAVNKDYQEKKAGRLIIISPTIASPETVAQTNPSSPKKSIQIQKNDKTQQESIELSAQEAIELSVQQNDYQQYSRQRFPVERGIRVERGRLYRAL